MGSGGLWKGRGRPVKGQRKASGKAMQGSAGGRMCARTQGGSFPLLPPASPCFPPASPLLPSASPCRGFGGGEWWERVHNNAVWGQNNAGVRAEQCGGNAACELTIDSETKSADIWGVAPVRVSLGHCATETIVALKRRSTLSTAPASRLQRDDQTLSTAPASRFFSRARPKGTSSKTAPSRRFYRARSGGSRH